MGSWGKRTYVETESLVLKKEVQQIERSNDAYQVPVKFEAKVKVGRVFGTVKQIKR